jgi:hypothetical protein
VQPLGREDGKAVRQVETHLVAEDAQRAGAGAVALLDPRREHPVEEVEVLPHGRTLHR